MSAPDVSRARTRARIWIWIGVGLVVVLAVFVGIARATDSSAFCNTCHEMKPYYAAWASGAHGHEGAQCIDCHVEAGFLPRLQHKVVALGEVWNHFFGDRTFPRRPPRLPNAWCTRCHKEVSVDLKGFSHPFHESKGTCRDCHPTTGHSVTTTALKDAGIFNPDHTVVPFGRGAATVDRGKADVPGHVTVACTRCHDMKATGCPACHAAPKDQVHQVSTDCMLCHKPGAAFVFSHPASPPECVPCHKVPTTHPVQAAGKACAACHPQVGVAWTFKHPPSSAQCLDCHATPAKHPSSASGKACAACHPQVGVAWMFKHPPSSARCLDCHATPAKHPSSASGKTCTLCHAVGAKWSFRHPSGGATCSSCHKPPANHYGSNCASCHHRPGVTWAFTHPSAGEHSWRSFACSKCHARGYSTAYCSCHGGNPPSD